MKNIMSQETQMRKLFEIYYKECEGRPIGYTYHEEDKSWIVMDGIELFINSFNNEKDDYEIGFMCGRYSETFGDDVYHFKSFAKCKKVWEMEQPELDEYIASITKY